VAGPVVCFGEVLIRLSAPDNELLLQSARLDVCFGGAETNVAVNLARLGHASKIASVIADNGLGRAGRDELRRHGVDISGLKFAPGRMGLYFLTPGVGQRPSEVLYDRAGSTFAQRAGEIDWDQALDGAQWLHVSGVTAAVGPNAAAAALSATKVARRLGVKVSMDGNYRPGLWALWDGDAPAILGEMLSQADILFGDHRDIGLILRRDVGEGTPQDLRRAAAETAFAAFPNLQRMASTDRVVHSANHNDLTGYLFSRQGAWVSQPRSLNPIVDRIGGGDAFAAGMLHGVLEGLGEQASLDFAVAAAALKHAIPGDFNLASRADIEDLVSARGLDVKR
jgi:2-dehydro-3-deoxygluconokinase